MALAGAGPADAKRLRSAEAVRAAVVVKVSLGQQQMAVYHWGELVGLWPVSTARRGKVTPQGRFSPDFLSRHHRSSRYHNAPMPYSVFFYKHYAIHGTDQVSRLGRPASAGCIRLHPDNAAVLFSLVRREGKAHTLVEITR
ncbi:MAG: L,D-transpeptidase [Alphaproteobacteria bacterium]|nr:MAG: L,D-transpeptidase [Alphaproteobacteria bacterium]